MATETQIKYVVGNTVSTLWNRVGKSKLVWLVVGYIAVQAEAKFPQAAFATVVAFKAATAAFLPHAIGGVAAILFRSAVTKAELAANAVNPGVDNVRAVEMPKSPSNYGKIGAMIVLAGFLGIGVSACGDKSAQVKAGPLSLDTGNGLLTYTQYPPPPPPPLPPQLAK